MTADGSVTLVSTAVGQACHSRSGAWLEARERYALPTCLRERARALALSGDDRPVRLLDVGTGLGLTIAAALDALEGTGIRLDVVSLERDASVLAAAARIGRDAMSVDGAGSAADLGRSWAPVLEALARAARHRTDAHRTDAGPDSTSEPLGADRGRLRLLLGDGRETTLRLMCRPGQDLFTIRLRQMRRQLGDATQVKTSIFQHSEQDFMLTGRPSHCDPQIGLVVRQV